MARNRKHDGIVTKLRQVEVLRGHPADPAPDRDIGRRTCAFRWRSIRIPG